MVSNKYRHGFTVLELLVAMIVLMVIVMLMTRVFSETSLLWQRGARQIQAAMEGRVIMDMIVRDMTQAIADDIVTFKSDSGGARDIRYGVPSVYGALVDSVCFVGLVHTADRDNYRRTANQFAIFVAPMLNEQGGVMTNRYRLVRGRRTRSMYNTETHRTINSAYANTNWWAEFRDMDMTDSGFGTPVETIAENVAAFELWTYDNNQQVINSYDSGFNGNKLPLWVDVYLELLSENDAIKMADLWTQNSAAASDFLSLNARRYTTRIFFPNRERALAFQ
jgi:hypothetical protein